MRRRWDPIRWYTGRKGPGRHRERSKRGLADEDVGEHQLVPALQEGVDAHGGHGGLHQRHDDPEEDPPDAAAVDARGLVQFPGYLIHKPCTDQDGHGKREGRIRDDQRPVGVEQMQPGQRDVHWHDGCVDGDGQAQHEELVQVFPLLPDQPRQGKGAHQRHGQGDQDGGGGHDGAV